MTFDEFYRLFQSALERAVKNAEEQLGKALPQAYLIELYSAGHSGEVIDPRSAARALYLGSTTYYRIIDVAVTKVGHQGVTIFVRASSHTPSNWEATWNDPPGSGPFKQLLVSEIEQDE